jgi:hypothetical protein
VELAILVPILNRPHRIIPLLESIEASTDVAHEVIFAASDEASIDVLDKIGARYITDEGGTEGTWAKRINQLYKETNAPYIFTGADDLAFNAGWFQAAMIEMNRMQGGGVVAVNDLHNRAGVHFLMSREYIETFGGAMGYPPGTVACPEYLHQYTDDDIRSCAKFHDRWAFANDSIVEHLHTGAGKAPMDETYRIGEATAAQGREVYMGRGHLWAI